ncbi:hypothetical protein HAX54_029366 [Datura stramonium]|uniref:Uncharacterized protein n=1 Tax=Datura stramonium TaxID=4076 RepID=A0ABS8V6P0_DATST|nr:hypothetical protein [Datura stramonium]
MVGFETRGPACVCIVWELSRVKEREQEEEILRGLLDSERPFLWVRRKGEEEEEENFEYDDVVDEIRFNSYHGVHKTEEERVIKEVEGIVKREELKRCLGILMENGEKGEEIKRNVKKLSELAMEAVKIGGSSHDNLKKFM